jgi:uncharacterized protein YxjI
MTPYVVTEAQSTVLGGADLAAVGTAYHVCKPRERRILYTVVTLASSPPRFRLVEAQAGREVGALTSNFIKSRYEIQDAGRALAVLVFPAVAFDKSLVLTIGGDDFDGEGSVFRGVFQCRNGDGALVLEVAKQLSIRDTFSVKVSEAFPFQVGLLAAVAIHSRFYQMV